MNNILHRDIKIENILMGDFTENSYVRIADLGSATVLDSPQSKTGFVIGTPGYIAPELLLEQPYGLSADVWSLGCLLHVMLTAQPPFWSDDRKERKQRVCFEPLDFAANVHTAKLSSNCKEFLSLMLMKDPDARPTIS